MAIMVCEIRLKLLVVILLTIILVKIMMMRGFLEDIFDFG
jgi:hypothetical protein